MDQPAQKQTANSPIGSASAGYQGQSGGGATNAASNDSRSSEAYNLGGRSRYNLSSYGYLFGQASWLSDRFNGYDARGVVTAGYGRQLLSGPEHALRVEFGPGYRYDTFHNGGHNSQSVGYSALNYQWQISAAAKFIGLNQFW